jgi:hypothetical protein
VRCTRKHDRLEFSSSGRKTLIEQINAYLEQHGNSGGLDVKPFFQRPAFVAPFVIELEAY